MDAIVVEMDLAGLVALRAHLERVRSAFGEAAVDDVLHVELAAGLWGAPREVEDASVEDNAGVLGAADHTLGVAGDPRGTRGAEAGARGAGGMERGVGDNSERRG